MQELVRVMSNVMVLGRHWHIFFSKLAFHSWNRVLCAAKEKVEDVKRDLEGEKEKDLEMFEVESWALLHITRPGVYSRESC